MHSFGVGERAGESLCVSWWVGVLGIGCWCFFVCEREREGDREFLCVCVYDCV